MVNAKRLSRELRTGGGASSHDYGAPDFALAAKVAFDAANAAKLTIDQWTKQKAFCFWCLIAAGATFAMAPPAVSNLTVALRRLRRGNLGGCSERD